MSSKRFGHVKTNKLNGVGIIQSDQLLDIEDFPTITGSLYAWHLNETGPWSNGGEWSGGKALTDNATLTLGNNHLGDSTLCSFNGADWLSSSDAVFDHSGSFSTYSWLRPNAISGDYIIACKRGENGSQYSWQFHINSSGLYLQVSDNGSTARSVGSLSHGELLDGYPHFVAATYNASNDSVLVFIDGKIVAYEILSGFGTLHDASATDFRIGARNNTETSFFDGEIDEFGLLLDQVLDANDLRKIYATGCLKYCTQEASEAAKVAILDGRMTNGSSYVKVGISAQTVSPITGLKLDIPEHGYYKLGMAGTIQGNDASGGVISTVLIFNIDGASPIPISSSFTQRGMTSGSYGQSFASIELPPLYIEKNQVITVAASVIAGDTYGFDGIIWWEKID